VKQVKKRVLLIKTTSLGDVLHTLPAVTEALSFNNELIIDWVVEDSFSEVPNWHPGINQVHIVSIRRWRKTFYRVNTWKSMIQFFKTLRLQRYDIIIDAQGLFKSALILKLAKGDVKYGLDKNSAREGWASILYENKIFVETGNHAITRLQDLFGKIFKYTPDFKNINSGISYSWVRDYLNNKTIVLLHGTTWNTKHWPDEYWRQLTELLISKGYKVLIPWGNINEKKRANFIAESIDKATVLEKSSLTNLAAILSKASLVISVDTGLSHLSAACNTPIIGIYGATSSILTGCRSTNSTYVSSSFKCSPCLKKKCQISEDLFSPCLYEITPKIIFDKCNQILVEGNIS
jgi:heptosyltransferase I